ncbi:MAG: DNA repair exonuclease, partial [Verrucomicrobiota bacterium]
MEQAVAEAEGRLVAARIILSGSTLLHGSLHRDGHRWRAEMLARAQDQGEEAVWLEQVKIRTTPVYNVALLAQRDALTRIVVEGLDRAPEDRQPLPEDIRDMLEVLPAEIRAELEAEWSGEQRAEVLKDVRAIILEALGTKGGQVQ